METVYEQVNQCDHKRIYTYGPIIHNDEVIKDMKEKGVEVLHTEEELESLKDGVVIIRSHGVPKGIYDILNKRGVKCVDATCPFVKKIHRIVEQESAAGKQIVIIGDKTHPEVQGIMGWSRNEAIVIQTEEEAKRFFLPKGQEACVVSQTTFNYNKFKYLVEILTEKGYNISVLNTICSATQERQTEAESIAKEVDVMVVIGDKHSFNTQKLYEICKNACNDTYFIQTVEDFDVSQLTSVESVGITAGASTPKNIIEEVQKDVRFNF